mmetsp:Transcript_23152/g.50583  ORF Transcript_23152/g.50583 Transcript_23152/m.50583 type:complete len:245 (-) Transcript_23152:245-979(-)
MQCSWSCSCSTRSNIRWFRASSDSIIVFVSIVSAVVLVAVDVAAVLLFASSSLPSSAAAAAFAFALPLWWWWSTMQCSSWSLCSSNHRSWIAHSCSRRRDARNSRTDLHPVVSTTHSAAFRKEPREATNTMFRREPVGSSSSSSSSSLPCCCCCCSCPDSHQTSSSLMRNDNSFSSRSETARSQSLSRYAVVVRSASISASATTASISASIPASPELFLRRPVRKRSRYILPAYSCRAPKCGNR